MLIEPEELYHWCGAESYERADEYNIERLCEGEYVPGSHVEIEPDHDE